jgi:hypothetical protein
MDHRVRASTPRTSVPRALAPPAVGRWGRPPGSIALAEVIRWSCDLAGACRSRPFAISQAASPIAFVVRLGGSPLLVILVVAIGVMLPGGVGTRGRHWPSVPR